jgi:signal transduction histidine kinase
LKIVSNYITYILIGNVTAFISNLVNITNNGPEGITILKKFVLGVNPIYAFFIRLAEPRKDLKNTDDYYKLKIFNTFAIISIIITLINGFFRLWPFLINNNNNNILNYSILISSSILIFLVIFLLLLGKSKYYIAGFYIFPVAPLLVIWSYYPAIKMDPSVELLILNPTIILIIGLVVGGLLLSIKELVIFILISISDMILFYGIALNYSIDLIIPRFLALFLVGIFTIINATFRVKSYNLLHDVNYKLTKEVDVKQNSLIEERSILYALIANLKEGVIILDFNQVPLLVNNNFISIYEEITNTTFKLDESLQNGLEEENLFYKFISKTSFNQTITEIHEFNKKFYLLIKHLLKVNLDSKNLGTMIEIQDITELKAVDVLEKNFRTVIMHELRTPTTSLQLAVSNLIKYWERLSEGEVNKLLISMQNSINKFSNIVKKVSLLSDLEINKEVTFLKLDIKSFIQEIKKEFIKESNDHKIVLIDLVDKKGLLNLDKKLIFQVIRIIIDNAEKFSPKKSEILITCLIENLMLIIEITDQGLGMDKLEIPLAFNRFYKGTNSENIPGEGLGLSIAKEILVRHKGDIEFISKLHEGSKIKIVLPIIKLLDRL